MPMVRNRVEELLRGGLPPGWRARPGYPLPGGTIEWEIVPAPGTPDEGVAPIVNYLLRLPPEGGYLLLLFDNCDAGVGGIQQLAPVTRALPLILIERLPELLRRVVGVAPPNRFGLT